MKNEYVQSEKLPHFKKRLYHSMIWENYELKQPDEINYH